MQAARPCNLGRSYGIRGVSSGKRRSMESLAKPCGRITMQAHGVLEQGHAICRRESHAFWGFFCLFFWLLWVFVAACRLSPVAASRGYSSLWCTGFSWWWLLLLRSMGSRRAGFSSCGSGALERRLSFCGARASLLHGMWDLPGPGLEPVCPALAGGFLTTVPPGKSLTCLLKNNFWTSLVVQRLRICLPP